MLNGEGDVCVCVYVLLYIAAAAYFVFLSRLEEENGDLEWIVS